MRLLAVTAAMAVMMAGAASSSASAEGWNGLNVGVDGVYGWGKTTSTRIDATGNFPVGFVTSRDLDGWGGGGHVGYDMQYGNVVVGIEGSYVVTDIKGTSSAASPLIAGNTSISTSNVDWIGTITGRLGYSFNSMLAYGRGGVAWGGSTTTGPVVNAGTVLNNNFADSVRFGWTAGAGLEYALTRNIALRAEYDYVNFGTEENSNASVAVRNGAITTSRSNSELDAHLVKLGVSLRLN